MLESMSINNHTLSAFALAVLEYVDNLAQSDVNTTLDGSTYPG